MLATPHKQTYQCLIGLCLIFGGWESFAIEDLEEVIITAAQSALSVEDLPYSASEISRESIQRLQPRNMLEVLDTVPGVVLQKTANGQGSPFIRGFSGYRTLAMIDGIRYNNSVYRDGPNEYFSLIDSASLAGIELLRGPASTLYGSDAVGGTLNIRTQSPLDSRREEGTQYLAGSQSFRYASAEHSQIVRSEIHLGEAQHWGLNLSYSDKNFGDVDAADLGVLPTTGYEESVSELRFDRRINEYWVFSLMHQSLMQDDVWRTHSSIYSRSYAGTSLGSDLHRSKDQQRSLNYLRLNGQGLTGLADDFQLTLSRQTWGEKGRRVKSSGDLIEEYFDSRMTGIDLRVSTELDQVYWTYGADLYRDIVDTGRREYGANGELEEIRIQGPVGDDSSYDLLGTYVQAEWFVTDSLTLTVGSRFTRTNASVGAYEDPSTGEAASYSEQWNSHVSSLRASFAPTDYPRWRLWGGLSQSFRAPNIADISRYGKSRSSEFEIATTELDAESFTSLEFGSRFLGEDFDLEASFYYTDINDFIASTATGLERDGLSEVSKQNSAGGRVYGVELSTSLALRQWQLHANLSWLKGELEFQTQSLDTLTEPFSRMMPLTAHLSLERNLSRNWWFQMAFKHAAKADKLSRADMEDTQRIPPGGTPAYTVLDIRVNGSIGRHIDLNMAVENVTDETYRSHGSGINEPGRSLVIGMDVKF